MKFFTIFSTLFLCINVAAAQTHQGPSKDTFNGAQLSVSVGYAQLGAKSRVQAQQGGAINSRSRFSMGNYCTKASIGYTQNILDSYNIGGDAYYFYNPLNAKTYFHSSFPVPRLTRHYGFGARMTGGYFLNDQTLFFVGLGIEGSQFALKGDSVYTVKKDSHFLWSSTLSAGLKIAVRQNISLFFEGGHSFYGQLRVNGNGRSNRWLHAKMEPRVSMISIGAAFVI